VIGDASVIRQAVNIVEAPLEVRAITSVSQATFQRDVIDVFDLKNVDLSQLELGKVSAMAGNAAFEAVRMMIKLAMSGDIAATVTAPIIKRRWCWRPSFSRSHRDLRAFTGTSDFAMMLAAGNLRVVHVSTHVSLRQAAAR